MRARITILVVVAVVAGLQLGAGAAERERGYGITAVMVDVADDDQARALANTGMDVVDHGDGFAEVWLHGPADLASLTELGLPFREVDYSRLAAEMARLRAAEGQAQAAVEAGDEPPSGLPTGRVAYRTLDDVNADLQALAQAYPDRVKLFELPHASLLGTTVYGVEISRDVHVESGKPVFLMSGVHHAREWPTAELTTEFAWDVLLNDGTDARITGLLERAKLIVVPVVNPDGYEMSRSLTHEQKRKNCRVVPQQVPTREQCASPAAGQSGVDLNRNYGAFWSGPGSGHGLADENHYGAAPYSEPEVRNIVELTAAHQVTVAIHNHTPDGRLLRAPSSPEEPVPADVEPYDALAQQLGGVLGWPAGPWPDIYYVASGVAEEHAYYSAGIFGFTTEATPGYSGLQRFHPPYQAVIEQYLGVGEYSTSNIREAFLQAWEAAARPDLHAVLTGEAPAGMTLRLSKSLSVDSTCTLYQVRDVLLPLGVDLCSKQTNPAAPVISSPLDIATTMTVPNDGRFVWHVQPSVRPSQYDSVHLDEAWALTCLDPSGATIATVEVTVQRGERKAVDLGACA